MKLLFLCTVALCVCLLACNKTKDSDGLVSNTVTFSIFTSLASPPPAGDTTLVTIKLEAYISNDNGNSVIRGWDTILQSRRLVLYPDSTRPLKIGKSFDRIAKGKEYLYFKYTADKEGNRPVRSFSNGYVRQAEGTRTVPINL